MFSCHRPRLTSAALQVTWNAGSAAAQGGSDPVHAWCLLSSGALLAQHAKLLIQYAADPLVPLGVVMELPGAFVRVVLGVSGCLRGCRFRFSKAWEDAGVAGTATRTVHIRGGLYISVEGHA